MLIVISPAKSLDYETPPTVDHYTQPDFLDEAQALIDILKEKSPAEVAVLMDLSDTLAALNVARYGQWHTPFSPANAKQAVLAFNGDVYEGLAAPSLSVDDLAYAQVHLRILSGLYGLLRPLDLIQPYRLEMGTRLANARGKDLYAWWGSRITEALKSQLAETGEQVVVNLASEEYFKAVKPRALGVRVVTPVFEDWKNGRYKVISFYAKRARGLMSRYAITRRLACCEGLKGFDSEGYAFAEEASSADAWVFRRRLENA